ncbi:uncharacterized protein LOC141678936 isoform X2 [Apium graveolens]|uniref:uncharacterized protein LOC141678936 isoform X2 n=1 Tax=Apium graveolens TaxID=4045 RepID=UPI003D7BAD8B
MRITELLLSRCNRLSATVDNDWNAVEISQLKGDRKDFNCTRSSLAAEGFDVVYDINALRKSLTVAGDGTPMAEQRQYGGTLWNHTF